MNETKNNKRIIALDVGTVRIGVAASDPTGAFAQGVSVLRSEGDWIGDLEMIIEKYSAEKILVGMPRRTDGNDGPEAVKMRLTVERLRIRFPNIEITTWDERFTTVIANQAMLEGGVSRARRRNGVDKVAAAVLLQNYLDSLSGTSAANAAASLPRPGKNSRGGRHDKRKSYG
ncbi:MAG: Holliday junction resolvase RuvX [Synergistaceae bacterium]|jgi:putative Holliday junction resolvase|nr:Holliday junction resolvase RuvX [Synergistaceae bacterium]